MASARAPRRIRFKLGRLVKREQRAVSRGLNELMAEMTKKLQSKIDTPYPPPSRPGRPPHRRTGFLHGNVKAVRKGRTYWISVPQYGTFLEGGTSKMAARPFIRPTIHKDRLNWLRRANTLIRKHVR